MAGFEVIVRPVVFPNIRPAPAQPLPPADEPDKGFATIRGNGGKQITLSYSHSSSASSSTHSEIERRVDQARIYQKNDDGSINKDNFIDVEAANRIRMAGPPSFQVAANPVAGFDVFDVPRSRDKTTFYYGRIREEDNIKIIKTDVIKKKEGA